MPNTAGTVPPYDAELGLLIDGQACQVTQFVQQAPG